MGSLLTEWNTLLWWHANGTDLFAANGTENSGGLPPGESSKDLFPIDGRDMWLMALAVGTSVLAGGYAFCGLAVAKISGIHVIASPCISLASLLPREHGKVGI